MPYHRINLEKVKSFGTTDLRRDNGTVNER
jgi:hypothetical protein